MEPHREWVVPVGRIFRASVHAVRRQSDLLVILSEAKSMRPQSLNYDPASSFSRRYYKLLRQTTLVARILHVKHSLF